MTRKRKLVPILCRLVREVNPNIDESMLDYVSSLRPRSLAAGALLSVLEHEILHRRREEARSHCRARRSRNLWR